jgi:acyl carrier protein phosphodiesterase
MNYLGHAWLSGEDDGVLAGNFTGDFFKGSGFKVLPKPFVKGVILHRFIDAHTDQHVFVKRMKTEIVAYSGRYSGVVVDVWMDYLLSRVIDKSFTIRIFDRIRPWHPYLPDHCKYMLQRMEAEDWLGGYAEKNGVADALRGIKRRRSVSADLVSGLEALPNSNEIEGEFLKFIDDMKSSIEGFRASLDLSP